MSEYQRFIQDKGEMIRYDYLLNENSLVWDIGGYKGEFAENIFKKFGCNVRIFEPVFFDDLRKKFKNNPKIHIESFGLSNISGYKEINVSFDSTTLHKEIGIKRNAYFMDIGLIFMDIGNLKDNPVIDLIKINVEGEEYNILERMLDIGKIQNLKNIQVQFHNFIPNCENRRDKIRERLSETHECTWCYSFIWENWRLK